MAYILHKGNGAIKLDAWFKKYATIDIGYTLKHGYNDQTLHMSSDGKFGNVAIKTPAKTAYTDGVASGINLGIEYMKLAVRHYGPEFLEAMLEQSETGFSYFNTPHAEIVKGK